MAEFKNIIDVTLHHEGGYVNDPDDAGGETNFGISKRAYPDLSIKELTPDMAKLIYKKDYWDKVKGDSIQDEELAQQIFDMAVNAGVKMASKIIQRLVSVTDDGIIGTNTLLYINAKSELAIQYRIWRIKYYIDICRAKKSQRKFLYAWVKRCI